MPAVNKAEKSAIEAKEDDKPTVDSLQFTARVREHSISGNTSSERRAVITLLRRHNSSVLQLQRQRNASAGPQKRSGAAKTSYYVDRCVKVTAWDRISMFGSMAIHFEKADAPLGEEERRHLKSNNKSLPRKTRTQITTLTLREWSKEFKPEVKALWQLLHNAASARAPHESDNRKSSTVQVLSKDYTRISSRPFPSAESSLKDSVISKEMRLRERRFGRSGSAKLAVKDEAPRRLSQGQRIARAITAGGSRKASPYSALTNGVSGKSNFSRSLIGSPNLTEFEKPLGTSSRYYRLRSSRLSNSDHQETPNMSSQGSPSNTPLPSTTQKRGVSPSRASVTKRKLSPSKDSLTTPAKRTRPSSATSPSPTATRSSEKTGAESRLVPNATPAPVIRDSPVLPSGIANDGNTCYVSAAVQAIMCDQVLMKIMRNALAAHQQNLRPFTSALSGLADKRAIAGTLSAGQLREAVSKHFPEFASSRQQDVHEFFLRCLDVLDIEFRDCTLRNSPTHSTYCLVQERKFQCTSCGHCTEPRHEILRGLSLDIPHLDTGTEDREPDAVSLQNLLNQFFASQQLELNCEKCSSGKQARSSSEILLAPRVLALHIKRFRLAENSSNGTMSMEKANDSLSIPDKLHLDSSLAEQALSFRALDISVKPRHVDTPKAESLNTYITSKDVAMANPTCIYETAATSPGQCAEPTSPDRSAVATQPLSQITQIQSPLGAPDVVKSTNTAMRGKRIQARFLVHGKDGDSEVQEGRRDRAQTKDMSIPIPSSTADDIVDDDFVMNLAPSEGSRLGDDVLLSRLDAIMRLGLSRFEAMDILRRCNFDMTAAIAATLDMQAGKRDNKESLDDALLAHVESLRSSKEPMRLGHVKKMSYRLAAVIRHCSDSVERGHYIADVRQPDGSWLCYDDSRVSKLVSQDKQSQEAYMCWYIADE